MVSNKKCARCEKMKWRCERLKRKCSPLIRPGDAALMEFSGAHGDQRAFSNNTTKDHTRFKKILLCLVIGRTEMGQGGGRVH